MANIPSALGDVMPARLAYLLMTPGATDATADTFVQMLDWNFSGDHDESSSAYSTATQYDYGRGGINFRFSLTASTEAYNQCRNAYNFSSSNRLPLTTFRIRYFTAVGANALHVDFTGGLKHFEWDRPRHTGDELTINCVARLFDANYAFTGTVPTPAAQGA